MEKFPTNTPCNTEREENKIEKPQIRQGLDFVFEQNPELSQIGTKEQYLEYLDAVFPDSIIHNILYRGDKIRFSLPTASDSSGYEIYLTTNKNTALQYGDRITTAIIDSANPYYTNERPSMYWKWINDKSSRFYGHDSVVLNNGQEVIVSPRQIHILGSDQDIGGFKSFVENYSNPLV